MPARTYTSARLSILVVDDEPAILVMLASIFQADGHTVGLADDGTEALRQFQENHWDVIVTDRAMPGMDGETLTRRIKLQSPQTAVIMMTGFAPPDCCAGADALVRKPFTRELMAEAITRSLASTFTTDTPPAPPAGYSAAA